MLSHQQEKRIINKKLLINTIRIKFYNCRNNKHQTHKLTFIILWNIHLKENAIK